MKIQSINSQYNFKTAFKGNFDRLDYLTREIQYLELITPEDQLIPAYVPPEPVETEDINERMEVEKLRARFASAEAAIKHFKQTDDEAKPRHAASIIMPSKAIRGSKFDAKA